MSRLAKIPVPVPDAVKLQLQDGVVTASNGKCDASYTLPPMVSADFVDGVISFKMTGSSHQAKANVGTARAQVINIITGLSSGYKRRLLLQGVGYRAIKNGSSLELSLGFSHPVKMVPPEGVQFDVPSQTEIVISGFDKQKVGQFASEVRSLRPPEPYKGKGVRYSDETVLRKEAKKKA
ncbi:MAG: 50S ribosomal protein L6 [Candidatus Porifericomitaceae bacterium WSBS_2022_MAG_OTU9]